MEKRQEDYRRPEQLQKAIYQGGCTPITEQIFFVSYPKISFYEILVNHSLFSFHPELFGPGYSQETNTGYARRFDLYQGRDPI